MQQGSNVIIDTNIVVSAAISLDGAPAKVFELFLEKKIINYTTEKILSEVREVMNRPYFKEHIDEEYRRFILDALRKHSVIVEPRFNEDAVPQDKADNEFVNCALTAKADIISGNKHLLELVEYKGVKILGAKAFLKSFTQM